MNLFFTFESQSKPGSDKESPASRVIRVFISSTFRDMMEERDQLMTHTWPELRCFCQERQVELIEVDLRWGITEEQSSRKETLKICLDEIQACRPYFIGILGERYGWIPEEQAFTPDLKEEQPWLNVLEKTSVTELEILHGVLNNPEMSKHSFFYFRDPAYAKDRGPDFLPENPHLEAKQNKLKETIRNASLQRGISLFENYGTPAILSKLVLEQLKIVVNAEFPKKHLLDKNTRQSYEHESFADSHRMSYVARKDYYQILDRHVENENIPLVITGDSGCGKSALLANWVNHRRNTRQEDIIFQHYLGNIAESTSHWNILYRISLEIKKFLGDESEIPESGTELLRDFPHWCSLAKNKALLEKKRFIVVLDGIENLEDSDHSSRLGWLPFESFSGSLQLIISASRGNILNLLSERNFPKLNIEPFSGKECQDLIIQYLASYRKQLNKDQLERICANPATSSPQYITTLLHELRITGTHSNIDQRLDEYLSSTSTQQLLGKVLNRYQHDYEYDHPGLVCEVLSLVWASRRGLSEVEILELLKPADLPQLPLAIWSPLRAALEGMLLNRVGILSFSSENYRTVVESSFLNDPERQNDFRLRLAEYFGGKPINQRTSDELPWLLWKCKERNRLRNCLLDVDYFLNIYKRDQIELMDYWLWLKEESQLGPSYLSSFNKWSHAGGLEGSHIAYAANSLGVFLYKAAFYHEAEALYQHALKINEAVFDTDHIRVAKDLNCLAQVYRDTGKYNEAESLLRRAIQIGEDSLEEDHPDMAVALSSLAQILQDTNRLTEAEPLMRRALTIHEKSYGQNHPKIATRMNNLAQVLQELGKVDESEYLTRRALAIDENNLGNDHPEHATGLNNLAMMLFARKQYDEAESLMLRALKIDEEKLGSDHPNVARDLNNLATLYHMTNRLEQAESHYHRALKIDELLLGADNPTLAANLSNLVYLLYNMERFEEALELGNRIIGIFYRFTKRTGHSNSKLQTAFDNCIRMFQSWGWADEEIQMHLSNIEGSVE